MTDEVLLKEMGKRISRRRQELGFTQEQVAEQMDVSLQMISNLELGKKAIRPENLVRLCRVLQISADYILTGRYSDLEADALSQKIRTLQPGQQKILSELVDCLLNAGQSPLL